MKNPFKWTKRITRTVNVKDTYGRATGDTKEVTHEVLNAPGIALTGIAVLLGLIFMLPVLFGFYTNDPGERSVTFNKFTGEYDVTDEGIHWRYPYVTKIWQYDIRDRIDTAPADAASSDLQVVTTTITVRYHPSESELFNIHRTIGTDYLDKVIRPAVQESVKSCTAKFTYTEMVQNRSDVKDCMVGIVGGRLAAEGIVATTVDIVNYEPPSEVTRAITAKEAARQEALRQENLLAASEAIAAQAIAEARGQSEAAALLSAIPNSDVYMYLEWLKVWNGELPRTLAAGSEAALFLNMPSN